MSDYERIERLGAGNYGEVWLVYDRALNVRRAIKYITSSRIHDPTRFYNEPHMLMELRHENVVRVEDAGRLPDGTLFIAMEYLPKGSVETIYRGQPVPMRVTFKILKDICWALEYAHNRDCIHRDIKPANILVTSDVCGKLSDFGLATRVPRGATASLYGYLSHVAPEVFRTRRTSKMSDIYALGVTAYRMINGDGFLPHIHDLGEIQDLIIEGEYPDRTHYRPYVPVKVQRIINKCMEIDPSNRYPNAATIRIALESIHLHCDWRMHRIKKNIVYFTTINGNKYRVAITQDKNGKYYIETTKQINDNPTRRVLRDCYEGMTLSVMKKNIRKVLPRYIVEGR